MNSIPPFSQNRGDIKYIKFEILQIMSPSEDVKFSNVRKLYLRYYGISFFLIYSFFLGDSAKKQSLIFEAVDYGLKAIEIDELNSEAHKW